MKSKSYYIEGAVLSFVSLACFLSATVASSVYQPIMQSGVILLSGAVGVVSISYALKAFVKAALMKPAEDMDPSALTGSQL